MKIILKYLFITFLLMGLIIIHSCKKEELPSVSTSSIANITVTSASSGGNVTSDGGAEVTARGICWSLNANPSISEQKTNDGTGTGQFVSNLIGLSAGLTYHVRAYAINSVGTAYGADMTFATLGQSPACLTQPATNITAAGATFNGTVNPNHLSTTITFEYGLTTSYGQSIAISQGPLIGSSITNVSEDVSGLAPGTTYHYRVVATNQLGTTYGNDATFTTGTTVALSTNTITEITYNSAFGGGNITSGGGSAITARGVCWSSNANPTLEDSHTLDGTGTGAFTSSITGLSSNITYYVRAYATNGLGTTYGNQVSFTTCTYIMPPKDSINIAYYDIIVWNWHFVSGATGYKWNTINDYDNAINWTCRPN